MDKLEKYINYDWEDIITRVIEGLKEFIKKFQAYMPKAKPNYEDPANYEF